MKKLTKIRLINWHYFSNETIEVHNNILLSGQNASGKSTILDAISFVMTAGDQSFNMAANEKGKRDLRGYVKCKLGQDDREYLREGDITGHISLEFYDELKKCYFVIGVVIDAFGEMRPKSAFYSFDGRITDSVYSDSTGVVYSIMNFKKVHRDFEIYTTNKEAKSKFRTRFGSVNERYFQLIPKALAFKPISDVKDFIYQHLLEEKKIEVESIQDSIRSYKELEETLKVIKRKIEKLDEIQNKYEELKNYSGKSEFYQFVIESINIEKNNLLIKSKKTEIERQKNNSDKKNLELRNLQIELDNLDERSKLLYTKLQSNDNFKNLEVYDKQIEAIKKEMETLLDRQKSYQDKKSNLAIIAKDLKIKTKNKIYEEIEKLDKILITEDNLNKVQKNVLDLDERLRELNYNLLSEKAKLQAKKEEMTREIQRVSNIIRKLENRKLSYSDMIIFIQSEIQKQLTEKYKKDISVHILAELLEITDASWHDTIEDFLAGQRFNLVVEPRYYDEALRIYDNIKRTRRIFGIGLINTKKISQYTTFQKDSLASIIETDNQDARHYINYYCGNVIMCEHVDDLDKYSASITKNGMLYRGYIVRPLNDQTEKPFIGKNAVDNQRRKYNQIGLDLRDKYLEIEKSIDSYTAQANDLARINLKDYSNYLDIDLLVNKKNEDLKSLIIKKQELSKKGISALEKEYDEVVELVKLRNEDKNRLYMEIGRIKSEIENLDVQIKDLTNQGLDKTLLIEEILKNNITYKEETNQILKSNLNNLEELTKIQKQYETELDIEKKNLLNIEDSLKTLQYRYDIDFNTGYGTGVENMTFYSDELNKLVKSELIKYEAKVRQAREKAELVFKEDFLSKLRDYIKTAQQEIKDVNDALKSVKFGSDSYQFIFPKSQEYGGIYEMVVQDDNFAPGQTIFTADFEVKYEQELERLFDELSQDELNSKGALSKFMDYRTYMDYDIEITNNAGHVLKYSRVFKEKSGGETQVPFYVAVIASFVQIYQTATKNPNNDAVCLVLFDEVFDKMDSTRIKAMMSFIKELPIQIILATPPQRIEIISKYTDTTVIVYRDQHRVKTEQTIKLA